MLVVVSGDRPTVACGISASKSLTLVIPWFSISTPLITVTGVGEVLKVARPNIKIIGTEPEGAALLSGNDWQPHKIQGWTPDFIPDVMNQAICDEVLPVSDTLARDTALSLARNEGIFCGISAGATFAAALKVAETAVKGSSILAMLPDTGERYLSTFLFEDIEEGSDEDILATLNS